MNPLSKKLVTGTIGELFVQPRLFQYNVQSAPPLKDSGNDLIAIRDGILKTIQVKATTKKGRFQKPKNSAYNILAWVWLEGENSDLYFDQSKIYLFPKEDLDANYLISSELIDKLFPRRAE